MYNPCRGGVRGGADQFTWESVKTDKHRENYLGHSLKAPVGRWQKGKDLSWYAKERKNDDDSEKTEQLEMAAIKRAEEEAMLIALGHKVTRKESQLVLSKEEVTEALKRNIGDRDEQNIERIDGVGASSRRSALMTGVHKDSRSRNEGVVFESRRERKANSESTKEQSPSPKRSKAKKKSKKHKKEKTKRNSEDSDSDEPSSKRRHKKHERNHNSSRDFTILTSKEKHKKRLKHKHPSPRSSDSDYYRSSKRKLEKHKSRHEKPPRRNRHDTSESD